MQDNQIPEPDVVTQAQNELDTEQGLNNEAQPLTLEQVRGLLDEQNRVAERQIAGIASKVDKGLNTMRSIAESAQQATGVLRSDMTFEQMVANMDEDQRAAMLAWRDADRRINAPAQPATPEPAPQADPWERVYRVAESMGLDRNDPNINYDILANQGISEAEREQQFMASLGAAVAKKGMAQTAPPAPPPPPPVDQTSNPPVDRGPAGAGSPMNNQDQIVDALIRGEINNDQYRQRMAAIGIQV